MSANLRARRILPGVMAVGLACTLTFAASPPAMAHHSFAMFDRTKQTTLKGTVKQFQWTNPHSFVQLLVMENGQEVEYAIEGMSPNSLARRGWNHHSIKAGDKLKIVMNPLKDGTQGGSFKRAIFPDGRVLTN